MSWVRMDDGWTEHPKLVKAGPLAALLWAAGLAYCNRQKRRTGVIPAEQVPFLFAGLRGTGVLAKKLVDVRLWEAVSEGFSVHDYHEYQPSAEDHEKRKSVRAEAGRLGGRKSGEVRRSKPEANPKQLASQIEANGPSQIEANANPDPDPDPEKRRSEESEVRSEDLTGILRGNGSGSETQQQTGPPISGKNGSDKSLTGDIPANYRKLEQSFWPEVSTWRGPRSFHADFARQNGLDLGLEERQYRANRTKVGFRCADFDADFEDWLVRTLKFARKAAAPAAGPERPLSEREKQANERLLRIASKQLEAERKKVADG